MPRDNAEIARASYLAYVDKDRAAIEALVDRDFHFTSPLDNRIDRDAYFARCWPNSGQLQDFEFIRVVENGDEVLVTYVASTQDGHRFRNTEVLTIRDGRIIEVEVYFGWSLPHKAAAGQSLSEAG
jgi:ketosteroid isomerase-like protein